VKSIKFAGKGVETAGFYMSLKHQAALVFIDQREHPELVP
jgi:hypothetical protein